MTTPLPLAGKKQGGYCDDKEATAGEGGCNDGCQGDRRHAGRLCLLTTHTGHTKALLTSCFHFFSLRQLLERRTRRSSRACDGNCFEITSHTMSTRVDDVLCSHMEVRRGGEGRNEVARRINPHVSTTADETIKRFGECGEADLW